MMQTKELSAVLAAAPYAAIGNKKLLAIDTDGSFHRLNGFPFAPMTCGTFASGSIIRITNLTSVLISVRGMNTGRASLVWVSSYGDGTPLRTSFCVIKDSGFHSFFVNGSSDINSCVYLRLNSGAGGSDTVSIVSLSNSMPYIEVVTSLPSDATLITAT